MLTLWFWTKLESQGLGLRMFMECAHNVFMDLEGGRGGCILPYVMYTRASASIIMMVVILDQGIIMIIYL